MNALRRCGWSRRPRNAAARAGRVEREQGRQQVVSKPPGAIANVFWHDREIERLEVGLLRVQRRCHQWRARDQLAVAVSTPIARPSSTTMRDGSSTGGCRRRSRERQPPAPGQRHAAAARHLRLAGLAIRAAMWWPKPPQRRSTSRNPLKNSRPAITVGCSNSRSTNSSGERALTSSSRRPEPSVRAARRRRLAAAAANARDRECSGRSGRTVVPAPQRIDRAG